MAQVLPFPTPDDRQVVLAAVNVFLTSGNAAARERMLKVARKVLDRYRVTQIRLHGFVVRAIGQKYSSIEATETITSNDCPGCGADIYLWPGKVRIVNIIEGIKEDFVTYGCACGRVFAKKEAVH